MEAETTQPSRTSLEVSLLESWPRCLIALDQKGRIVFANGRARDLLGWDNEALLGHSVHELLCSHSYEFDHSVKECPLLTDPSEWHDQAVELFWVTKEGVILAVDICALPAQDETGSITTLLSFEDGSARRAREVELRRLSLFSDLNPIPIAELDEAGLINFANPAMTELLAELGYNDEGFAAAFPVDLEQIVRRCLDTQEAICDVQVHAGERWLAWYFHPAVTKGLVVAYGEDFTRRKQAEENLRRARDVAESANRTKTAFLASMSHELRTPLNAIIGYSELLEESAEQEGREEWAADLKRIRAAGDHLLALINDVLDISKIEAGRMDLCPEEVDVCQLLDDVSEIVLPLMEKNGNDFMVNCPGGIGKMDADRTRLRQVLFNLLSNAAKFTRGGQVAVDVSRYREGQSDWFAFKISDTGIGLSEEEQKRLFKPFSQAALSTGKQFGGTGLGLAISRRVCLLMGGDVTVESVEGEGSVFTAIIPAEAVTVFNE